jgi:uncharacterized protein (DUF885 family)
MFQSIGRRAILQALAVSAASAALEGPALAKSALAKAASRRASPARALMSQVADDLLALSPTTATGLGLDFGKHAPLRAQLDGYGPETRAKKAALVNNIRARIAGLNTRSFSAAERLQLETLDYAAARGQDGVKFSFGGGADDGLGGGAQPYVLTQQDGALGSIPEFLNSQHPIKTSADAEAWIARVNALGRVLDEESARVTADAARGVVPPNFVAANALGQLKGYRAIAPADQPLVASLAAKAASAGLSGDWAARCAKALEGAVYPALDRQIAAFDKATAGASDQAGVQRLPDGDAYYAYALRLGTTTTLSPKEIHETGLTQNEEIKAKIDAILKSQGLTQGSVGERVVALNSDPRFLYPDTDEGRAQIIAYINGRIAAARVLMPQVSHLPMKAPVEVKRVPPDIQDGQPLGYMNFASLDGSRPAIYYVNLRTTKLWPKYQLPTLSMHEALPGHAWQGAYLAEYRSRVPSVFSMMGFNAFVEGWALYAEQLMDEFGLYKDDPFGRIGYLQAQQFRACRLVVDTGLHAMGWTRQRSIDFLISQTGRGKEAMTSETDRYCVSPGQACGYKVGHNEIVRLRNEARTRLGAKFDAAKFNDTVVATGGVPLSLLEGVVKRAMG